MNGLFRTLFGPKKLKAELVDERNLLFAIAQCKSEPRGEGKGTQLVHRRLDKFADEDG